MRAEGEFTRHEVYRVRDSRSIAKCNLDTSRERLKRIRENAREGLNAEMAKTLGEALADEQFRERLAVLDRVMERHTRALKAFGRCSKADLTDTGKQRKQELERAKRLKEEAFTAYDADVEERCPEEGWRGTLFGNVHMGTTALSVLKGRLRRLIDSYKDGSVLSDITHQEAVLAKWDEQIALMESLLVPAKKLKQFALALTPAQRSLLVRMVDGYYPTPKTVRSEKSGAPFRVLVQAKLLELSPNDTVRPTWIAKDVVEWIAEYMDGEGLRRRLPAESVSAVKELFSEEQRQTMIAKARVALADIREHGESNELEELGIPEASYSIIRRTDAIQWFLRILGAHRERRSKNPSVKSYKIPSFTPGRLVEEPEWSAT